MSKIYNRIKSGVATIEHGSFTQTTELVTSERFVNGEYSNEKKVKSSQVQKVKKQYQRQAIEDKNTKHCDKALRNDRKNRRKESKKKFFKSNK